MLVLATGCNLLEGYYYPSQHFRFATVKEIDVATSLERTVFNVKLLAKQNDMAVKETKTGIEQAQIWASKGGLQYVFDIRAAGDSGCRIHLEIDQTGNDSIAWTLMTELQAYP